MGKINLIQRVVMEVNSKLIFIDFLLLVYRKYVKLTNRRPSRSTSPGSLLWS